MGETERNDDGAGQKSEAVPAGYELIAACSNKDVEEVKDLLSRGASPNACSSWSGGGTEEWPTEYSSTPALIIAFPSVEIVRLLLEAGADPNCATEQKLERGEYSTSALAEAEARRARSGPEAPAYAEIAELLRQYSGREKNVSPTDGMRLKFVPGEGWAYWEKVDDGSDQSE